MKAILTRISKITSKSKRTDILDLHEKLNTLEDKAQAALDKVMNDVHEAREQLDENSNNE